ncbi:MAG: hypothetical protein IKZ54_02520 [Bacteroidales bacterium]|nr:hypothetical protein [Bacteroidales bacterium]
MCNPSRGCGGCRIANGYREGTPNGVRGARPGTSSRYRDGSPDGLN